MAEGDSNNNSHEGKVFDTEGYKKALEESGYTIDEAYSYWKAQSEKNNNGGNNSHEGKVFDTEGYKKALEESGLTINDAYYYWLAHSDPFAKAQDAAKIQLSNQLPKITIENNTINISAPQEVLNSPLVEQIKTELQTLKGANLQDAEVVGAINALNNEIQTMYSNALNESIRNQFGWTEQQLKDYNHLVQIAGKSNPTTSTDQIKGYERGGTEPVAKKFQEWIDYYREAYNTEDRTDALIKSAQSSDPYARTMYLVLTQGGDTTTYGFDAAERVGQGWKAFVNQMGKYPEGTFRTLTEPSEIKRAEALAKDNRIPTEVMRKFNINTEDKFEEIRNAIKGKSWNQLNEEEKAFLILLGASREDRLEKNYEGGFSRATYRDARKTSTKDLNEATSREKNEVSRRAISRILSDSSFKEYQRARDDYDTWQGYGDWSDEGEKELAKTAIWSANEQGVGNFIGVIGRYLWENATVHGLTGGLIKPTLGLNMNRISDVIGSQIVKGLAKIGLSPSSPFGKSTLGFFANLIGTVPEDMLQTAVDNVLTYNADENKNLLNPEDMAENVKRQFLWVLAAKTFGAGWSSIKRYTVLKMAEKAANLKKPLNITGSLSDMDDMKRAIENGGSVEIENGKVVTVDADGTRKVLNNITPEDGKLFQNSLFDMDEGSAARKATEADGETAKPGRTIVDADTPDGPTKAEVPDYRPKGVDDALSMDVEANAPSIKLWHTRSTTAILRKLGRLVKTMQKKFGDVQVSDFDWVRYNVQKLKKTAEEIIGTTDPTTGRTITKNHIEAMKWWAEQPDVKKLREASAKAVGKKGDNILGYMPQSSYDPSNESFDEAYNTIGVLWEHSTGAAMLDEDGNYKGYGGTFNSRNKTFVSNMLWDAVHERNIEAKLIEEAKMNGVELSQEDAKKVIKADKEKIRKPVTEAESTKEIEKNLTSGKDAEKTDWDALDKKAKEEAQKADMGQATHDVYAPVYRNADTGSVVKQHGFWKQGFDTLGNTMRNTVIEYTVKVGKQLKKIRVSLYDSGGADYINAAGNGLELVRRIERAGGSFQDLRDAYIEYLVNRGTIEKYAVYKADKMMKKLAESQAKGLLDEAEAAKIVGNTMKWEAWGRMRKFIVISKYGDFNDATKKMINNLMFSSMQTEALTKSPKITDKIAKGLEKMTSFRYKALMYGNFKNALLQLSELNRLFVTFKWGDIGKMIKRLSTDDAFRVRVEDYAEAIAPQSSRLKADLYQAYSDTADTMTVTKEKVTFKDKLKNKAETVDRIALAPIESAERLKNNVMIAALVQEADSMGLTGDEALRHIRSRFERVALASNKMGQLGFASNPIGRVTLFLQNFQIREAGMHVYNIVDELVDENGKFNWAPKNILDASKYLTKVLGTKFATLLIMARLGYSAEQVLGLDPLGVLGNNYNKLDDEDMEIPDYFFNSPLFSGGMLSVISDLYFMSRRAYEESHPQTLSEEVNEALGEEGQGSGQEGTQKNSGQGDFWQMDNPFKSFDDLMGFGANFAPGNVFFNRLGQMNEMMDTGWAISSTGNKMYRAPEDPWNIIKGYLFGRSATNNALQYNQSYGDNLLQILGRTNPFRGYREFDPIDRENFTDWFKGDGNDLQQFNLGIQYFTKRRDEIIEECDDKIRKSYASNEEKAAAVNDMNAGLGNLFEEVQRFVKAYEDKNGVISSDMTRRLVNLFNTYQYDVFGEETERSDRYTKSLNKALERYSSLGLSPVGYYTNPSNESNPEGDARYYASPQYQAATKGYKNRAKEAVKVLEQVDKELSPVRKNLKDRYNNAYTKGKSTGDWSDLNDIQYEYLEIFDQKVSPVIALYGSDVLKDGDVSNQLGKMLSMSSSTQNPNLIPSEQYAKNKWGKYQSMPNQSVDPGKWAQERFSSDIYKHPTVRSDSTTEEDIAEIKKLASEGKNGRARARALQLWVRLDSQRRFLSQEDLAWLKDFLSKGSK